MNKTSTEIITKLYLELLHRDPDPGGLKSWTSKLNNGWSIEKVRKSFETCSERRKMLLNEQASISGRDNQSNITPTSPPRYVRGH